MKTATRHESATEPGTFFWAEPFTVRGRTSFAVVAQAPGGPVSEAFDDHFPNESDADEIAKQLAEGIL